MILHGGEAGEAEFAGFREHLAELPGIHGRCADIESFALADDLIERFESFFDGGFVIEAVDLIEIDVIGTEALQAVIDGVMDVLAGEAAGVGIVTHGVEDFGGDDDLIARRAELAQGAAGDLFTGAEGIHIGSVEEVDAGFDGAAEEGQGIGFFEDPFAPGFDAIGHGAQAELRNFETGGTQPLILHEFSLALRVPVRGEELFELCLAAYVEDVANLCAAGFVGLIEGECFEDLRGAAGLCGFELGKKTGDSGFMAGECEGPERGFGGFFVGRFEEGRNVGHGGAGGEMQEIEKAL